MPARGARSWRRHRTRSAAPAGLGARPRCGDRWRGPMAGTDGGGRAAPARDSPSGLRSLPRGGTGSPREAGEDRAVPAALLDPVPGDGVGPSPRQPPARGGREQVAGRRRQGRSRIPAGLPTRPGRRPQQPLALPGSSPSRPRSRAGVPGLPANPWDTGRGGRGGLRGCESEAPRGAAGTTLPPRRARGSGRQSSGTLQRSGSRPAGPTRTRDTRRPVPGKNNGRAEGRPPLRPTPGFPRDAFPCPTPALPSPPPVGPHHCGAARGKPSPATREWALCHPKGSPACRPSPTLQNLPGPSRVPPVPQLQLQR